VNVLSGLFSRRPGSASIQAPAGLRSHPLRYDDVTDDYRLDMTLAAKEESSDPEPLSDEELTALALAADPTIPLGDDAVPMHVHLGLFAGGLPQWYMPAALTQSGHRWRTPVVVAVIGAFVLIDVLGLCNTYGTLGL
jgi:hypothetical protein